MAFFKNFPVRASRFQIRGELFNALNRANFADPRGQQYTRLDLINHHCPVWLDPLSGRPPHHSAGR